MNNVPLDGNGDEVGGAQVFFRLRDSFTTGDDSGHGGLGQDKLEGALGCGERTLGHAFGKLFHLVDDLRLIFGRPLVADVAHREDRILGVLTGQKTVGQRLTRNDGHPFGDGSWEELFRRVTTQVIKHHLNGSWFPVFQREQAFGGIMNGNTVEPDLALGFQFFKRFKEVAMLDNAERRVVQLIEVDVIRAQAFQALLNGENQMVFGKVQAGRGVIEVTAPLGRDDDAVPVSL